MRYFWLALIIGSNSIAAAQDQRVADSLMQVWQGKTFPDTSKLYILEQIAFHVNDPVLSLEYADLLHDVATEPRNFEYLFKSYQLAGQAHALLGDMGSALNAYNDAADIADRMSDNDMLGLVYGLMAALYAENGNGELAIDYYGRSLELLESDLVSNSDSITLAGTYLNLGFAYYRQNVSDSALRYHELASTIFARIGYDIGTLYCLGNVGLIYAKMGRLDSAEMKIQRAIDQLEVYEDYHAITDFSNELADIYRQQGDHERALSYAMYSFQIAEEKGLNFRSKDASYSLYEIHMDTEAYDSALEYLNIYYSLRDSITNAENIQRLANLRTEFEVGQKQAEVDLLEAGRRNQRIIAISLASVLGLVMALAFVLYRNNNQKRRVNLLLEQQKKDLQDLNQTKDRFFSIISHDLRGPVNAFHGVSRMIKFFVKNKQMDQLDELAEEIDQSVDRLSSLLDNLLNWAIQQQGQVPYEPEKLDIYELSDDLVHVFQTMANAKRIKLQSEAPKGITVWGDRNTVHTILRNLLNNAIKFTPEEGQVTIYAQVDGDFVVMKVIDTGVGIPQERLNQLFQLQAKKASWGTHGEKGLGLGLQLVNEFVDLNGGRVEVESGVGQGTTFQVWLPTYIDQS